MALQKLHELNPGDEYLKDDGTQWRLIGYWSQPAVIMENITTKERSYFGVESEISNHFSKKEIENGSFIK